MVTHDVGVTIMRSHFPHLVHPQAAAGVRQGDEVLSWHVHATLTDDGDLVGEAVYFLRRAGLQAQLLRCLDDLGEGVLLVHADVGDRDQGDLVDLALDHQGVVRLGTSHKRDHGEECDHRRDQGTDGSHVRFTVKVWLYIST